MTEVTNWRKSSRSNGTNGSCVEVGTKNTVMAVRDSKDRAGAHLEFDQSVWSAFVASL